MLRKLIISIYPDDYAACERNVRINNYIELNKEELMFFFVKSSTDLLLKLTDLVSNNGKNVQIDYKKNIDVEICDGGESKGMLRTNLTFYSATNIVKSWLPNVNCKKCPSPCALK